MQPFAPSHHADCPKPEQYMPYNQKLADKIRASLYGFSNSEETEKMDGLSFMLTNKLLVRVNKGNMWVRCQPEMTDELFFQKQFKTLPDERKACNERLATH